VLCVRVTCTVSIPGIVLAPRIQSVSLSVSLRADAPMRAPSIQSNPRTLPALEIPRLPNDAVAGPPERRPLPFGCVVGSCAPAFASPLETLDGTRVTARLPQFPHMISIPTKRTLNARSSRPPFRPSACTANDQDRPLCARCILLNSYQFITLT
jgi:hypothetical protein